jgi:hypothetical protein
MEPGRTAVQADTADEAIEIRNQSTRGYVFECFDVE